MKKSFTEIYEGWSYRDVSLMLFYLQAQGLANEPDDVEFAKSIGRLFMQEQSQ